MDFAKQVPENNFWVVSSLAMKHDVISMIQRPNASTLSGDRKTPQAKEATDAKFQDQKNIHLLFGIRSIIHLY
jgi:hypothetical protein